MSRAVRMWRMRAGLSGCRTRIGWGFRAYSTQPRRGGPVPGPTAGIATEGAATPSADASPSGAGKPEPVSKAQIKEPDRRDVVIIGGGPAGLSLAAAIKSKPEMANLSIALVEGQNLDRLRRWQDIVSPDRYENRVSSLTPRSVRFLKQIGAWPHIVQERVKPYDEMRVWDGVSGASIDFDPFTLGESEDIAYMVENSNLQQALLARLDEEGAGNVIYDGRKVAEITGSAGAEAPGVWPTVALDDGSRFSSRLLVGADGQNSPVRTYADIASRGWDYGRNGLVASLKLEYDNFRSVAYQRFLPSGPIALLPLPDDNATLVWSTLSERASWLQQLEPEAFCAVVNAGFRLEPVDLDYIHSMDSSDTSGIIDEVKWRLQNTDLENEYDTLPVPTVEVVDGTRAAFPLRMRHADTYIGDRVALVGDAAHATHPLAGQGLNMGQRDVEYLVKALEEAVARGIDIGSPLALEPYWKAAYAPNNLKLGAVDKLHKLYSTDWWPLVQLRSVGLSAVNSSDMIKKMLMQQASN